MNREILPRVHAMTIKKAHFGKEMCCDGMCITYSNILKMMVYTFFEVGMVFWNKTRLCQRCANYV